MIEINESENLRYTIWRAQNPDAPLYEIFNWMREQWIACRTEFGLESEYVAAHQAEFSAWLCKKFDAKPAANCR